jgi:hypothetical protein
MPGVRSLSFPERILRWRTTKASPPGSAGARPGDVLLGAVRELEARLSELAAVYGGTSQGSFTAESLSRDFRELYLLRPDELPE